MEKKKPEKETKKLNIKDVTTCESTIQMLEKAEKDGNKKYAGIFVFVIDPSHGNDPFG